MKTLVKLSAVALVVAWASTAWGQASREGYVRIQGTVSGALKLAYWSHASLAGAEADGQTASNVNPPDGALDFTFNVGDLGAGADATPQMMGGTVTLALRSSANSYNFSAIASLESGTMHTTLADQGSGYLTIYDFGFGFDNFQCSGGDCYTGATTPTLDMTASNPTIVPYGDQPRPYVHSLADIWGVDTDLFNGGRICARGSNTSPGNALLVDTHYVVAPSLYAVTDPDTPEPFGLLVTYTLSNP